MWIGKFLIYKAPAGEISESSIYVLIDYYQSYMYTGSTIFQLFKKVTTEWRLDKHMVG